MFYCKIAVYFQNPFSQEHLKVAAFEGINELISH